jgi:SNF2 family DNA or RNA helicase
MVPHHNVNIIGKIKDSINCDKLIKSGRIYKNEEFVKLVNDSNYTIIPLLNYYDENVKKIFDLYGCIYEEIHDSKHFVIKIYFYKIKHIELLTKKTIEQFKLIFQYDYFNKNNILNMNWHSYRLSLFTKDVDKQKFMNLSYLQPEYCHSKLFNHQNNNISQMIQIYNNPEEIPIMDITMKFENGLIYDFVENNFIEEQDISKYKIQGGMILDEPGTGKTLQFILFLLELKKKSLVLVPNECIKKGWIKEFKKHITFEMNLTSIEIMTFDELEAFIEDKTNVLDNYDIIGIDEIHILYSKNMKLFDKIISSKIKSRWGITGTPFVNEQSLFNIIKFLTGHNFKNERIVNILSLQDKLIKLFLKNLKINMQEEYIWPELTIKDIFVELDIVQRKLYDTEAKTTFNKTNLRKIISEVQLLFKNEDIKTPAELKMFGINHYKKLYETELFKLEEINIKMGHIIEKKDTFEKEEYMKRVTYYKDLIKKQEESVKRHKSGYEYFMTSIEAISDIFKNEEVDDNCAICLGEHTPPIKYFKTCGHYFCSICIELVLNTNMIKCPICRKETNKQDIITVQDVEEINESPKLHEIYEILSKSSDKFIIFSQFNILDKFHNQLHKRNISAMTFDEYSGNKDECQVLLLSSEKNAEGINLGMFDKLIIFEPFEDHMYCKEIEKQLIARIHRIGRTKPVDVFRLITKDTIEEEIYSSISL